MDIRGRGRDNEFNPPGKVITGKPEERAKIEDETLTSRIEALKKQPKEPEPVQEQSGQEPE